MLASLRERVIEQIEPSVAATVSRDVLRRQIEEIIHGIANEERLELSGREQLQLADELADDMTGYGPLRPLLLDESINDIMVNESSPMVDCRLPDGSRVNIIFPPPAIHSPCISIRKLRDNALAFPERPAIASPTVHKPPRWIGSATALTPQASSRVRNPNIAFVHAHKSVRA